jgi:hypothetical protein
MTLQPFTSNFQDNSTDAGFQFTFFCDICREGYKTGFKESGTYKKAGLLRGIGQAFSIGASLAGQGNIGSSAQRGTDVLGQSFQGMSPEWHKEHEKAFELAQNEAKGHFQRCPKCKKYVCENDWNEEEGLCVDDAPRVAVEVAAAKGKKMVQDVQDKASKTQVFSGEITSKQTICPQCGKPAGEGKFCNSCGANLSMQKCPKCGASVAAGTKFCGECGSKMG